MLPQTQVIQIYNTKDLIRDKVEKGNRGTCLSSLYRIDKKMENDRV